MAACAAVALRLLFIFGSPHISDDSYIYGDIAKNWLRHGIYGLTGAGEIYPTYIRLPGYPAFLAVIFAIFGMEHYRAVLVVQMFFDIGTCLLVADCARHLFSERAAKIAFLLAAICPFLANYCAAALSETLEIFFTALALDLAIAGLQNHKNSYWVGSGLACSGAIFLRPDGGLLAMAIGFYLFGLIVRNTLSKSSLNTISTSQLIRTGILFSIAALAPLIPWTARNWVTMHRFEPLAPRYANEGDEYVDSGFNRWVKTWMADYVSVEEIYWNVPGIKIDAKLLPSRAFDSLQQKQQTLQIIDEYNFTTNIDPQLDQKFNSLAGERIHQKPFSYYVELPLLRIADMWLRPRTELLPPDPRWWEFNDDKRWLTISIGFGLLNLAYVGLACLGAWRVRGLSFIGLLLAFVIVRSVFLGSLENPETRYTLECYPAVILFVSALFRTS